MDNQPTLFPVPGEDTSNQVSLLGPDPKPVPTSPTAEARSHQYAFATGADDPNLVYQKLMLGQEDQYRKEVATRSAMGANNQRLEILQTYAEGRAKLLGSVPGAAHTSMTETERMAIEGLTQDQMHNPETILEELFAKQAVSTLYPAGNSSRQGAANENLNVAMNIQDATEEIIAVNEYAKRMWADLEDSQSKKGFINQATDLMGGVMPFLSQLNRHNAAVGAKPDFWTSQDMQNQYAHIRFQQGAKAQSEALKAAVDLIASHNQLDAINFLAGFVHYGSTDQFLDGMINVADLGSAVAGATKMGIRAATATIKGAGKADEAAKFSAAGKGSKIVGGPSETVEGQAGGAAMSGASETVGGQAGLDANHAFANAAKQTIQAAAQGPGAHLGNVAAASGRLDIAAAEAASFEAGLAGVHASDPIKLGAQLRQILPSTFNPIRALGIDKGYAIARESMQRVATDMMRSSREFFKIITSGVGIETLPPSAFKTALQAAEKRGIEDMARQHLSDMVIDTGFLPASNQGGVNYFLTRLGMPGGALFTSIHDAGRWLVEAGIEGRVEKGTGPVWTVVQEAKNKAAANKIAKDVGGRVTPGEAGYKIEIKQQGEGYYVEIAKPVQETGEDVVNHLVATGNTTPQSGLKTFMDAYGITKFMSPSNRLSVEQNGLRATTLNRQSEVLRLIGETWRTSIRPLNKGERTRIERFFDFMRREEWIDEDGVTRKGVEFTSQSDFEVRWATTFKQLPSEHETRAYWGYIQMHDMQLYIDSLAQYTTRVREGSRLFRFGPESTWMEARQVKAVPFDNPKANVQIMKEDGTVRGVYQMALDGKRQNFQDEVNRLIKDEGYTVLQVADPRRLKGVPVHFVVTKTASDKNLPFDLIPRQPGGHIVYDYPGFVKQAVTHKGENGYLYHYGDNTIIPVTTEAEGRKYIKVMEAARQLYAKGDLGGLKTLLDANPPFRYPMVLEKFKNGSINVENPFVYTRNGESAMKTAEMQAHIGDMALADEWGKSDLNYLKNVNRQFMGHRGWDVEAVGLADEVNPVMEFVKPRLIDPLATLSNALNQSVKNKMFGAYQMRTAEHFVEEFHKVMDKGNTADELARLRENPLRALHNPKWDKNALNKDLLAAGRSYQEAAIHLIGTQTDSGRWVQHIEMKMMDWVYNSLGKGAAEWTYEKFLPMINNPVGFARQVAFHSKLGLFNPVQLLLQAQTATVAVGVLGVKHGMKGFAGYALSRLLHMADQPENIEYFAKMASKLGWRAEDFKEAYKVMIDNGVFNMGSQHAWRWDAGEVNFARAKAGVFLDKGLFAFNEGERINRMIGFMGTYSEWRAANPLAKLDGKALTSIMARYDDVTVNMTHASSSALNRGVGAVAGQFFSYQERLMELLLGKRLKPIEKLRVFGAMSVMYGVPTAVGAWTFGGGEQFVAQGLGAVGVPIPNELKIGSLYDDLRSWALKNGAENNVWVESLMEGLPELLLHAATGEQYNFAQKQGPGSSTLWDDLAQNKPFIQFWLGASGNIGGDFLAASAPLIADLGKIVTGQGVSKLTIPDVMSFLENFSTYTQGQKAFYAFNLGRYMSKQKEIVDNNVTGVEGVMMALTGLTPNRIQDAMLMDQARKAASDSQVEARQNIMKYTRMWQREQDKSVRDAYAERIHFWIEAGGFSPTEAGDITSSALTENETKVDAAKRAFNNQFPLPAKTKE